MAQRGAHRVISALNTPQHIAFQFELPRKTSKHPAEPALQSPLAKDILDVIHALIACLLLLRIFLPALFTQTDSSLLHSIPTTHTTEVEQHYYICASGASNCHHDTMAPLNVLMVTLNDSPCPRGFLIIRIGRYWRVHHRLRRRWHVRLGQESRRRGVDSVRPPSEGESGQTQHGRDFGHQIPSNTYAVLLLSIT